MRDLDGAFLKRYDLAGPRYTSYPTAPEWNDSVTPQSFMRHLERTKSDWKGRPLSIYLHLPFCVEHCTFCACNVIISSKGREVSEPYLADLEREIQLHAERNDPARPVVQFHWGGGTPTYLDVEQIRRTHAMVASRFKLAEGAEQSIEIHPPVTTDDQLRALAELGFNRLSMGVQDFNAKTQAAINRPQTYERTKAITDLARSLGFVGINYDLVYGLPFQTVETFKATLDKVIEAKPDRLALYNFAFLPERLAHQRTLDPASLPDAEAKLKIFRTAHDRFVEAGYRYIGMDHFALPEDELARSFEDGTLHRNFMGFTTRSGTDLLGMGVSAISSVAGVFAQDVKKLTQYSEMIGRGELPIERGIVLSEDDAIRQRVIGHLMCRDRIEKREIENEFGIEFDCYFADDLEQLTPMVADGLLSVTDASLELTPTGRFFVRNIAMAFDAYLQKQRERSKRTLFSRTV